MPTPDPLPTAEPYVMTKDEGVTDIWFPVTAGRWTIKTSAQQTEGRLIVLLGREPRGATPLHVHHDADECIYVIKGDLMFVVGDERWEAGPGDFIFAPKGTAHAFVVRSEDAEILVSLGPAGTEGPQGFGLNGLFREIGIPVAEGDSPPEKSPPDPEAFARMTMAYQMEVVGPPPSLD